MAQGEGGRAGEGAWHRVRGDGPGTADPTFHFSFVIHYNTSIICEGERGEG